MHGRRRRGKGKGRDWTRDVQGYPAQLAVLMTTPGLAAAAAAMGVAQPGYQQRCEKWRSMCLWIRSSLKVRSCQCSVRVSWRTSPRLLSCYRRTTNSDGKCEHPDPQHPLLCTIPSSSPLYVSQARPSSAKRTDPQCTVWLIAVHVVFEFIATNPFKQVSK